MTKNYLIGIIFLSCFFSVSESRSEIILTREQQQKVAKIDSVLNFYHEQGILNGTVLVAQAGKVIYQKGFGYANMDTRETLEPKSVFRLASVSKQFTAMCIMMLEEQNKLNYDDDFRKYLPELKYEGVTIRHLLWHTSGMPDYMDFMPRHFPADEYLNDDVIKTMAKHHPEKHFKPGEKYEYSNTGYLLLGSIVERVSGVSFKEFLHKNIFDKIGMSSSIFPFGKNEFKEMPNRVRGYDRTKDGGYVDNDYISYDYDVCGDGGIFSNVIDLFKWNEALYAENLVKKETIQEAFKPYVLNDGSVGDYGFGWSINKIDSNTIVEHSGSWVGFRTHILRDITNKHCVIILTNVGNRNGTALYNACYNILMDKPFLRIIRIGEEKKQRDVERVSATLSIPNPSETLTAELTSLSPGKNEVRIKHDGQSRRLIVTTPKTYSRQDTYPVLFCFHGAGGKAEGQSNRWSPYADKHDLIVISAEAVQSIKKWNIMDGFHIEDHDDVGFISKVVDILIANKIADDKAIFATGHSSGGLFSYRLAKETDLFAAVSPMSCGMIKGAHDPDEKTKPISLMQIIGDKDKSFNGSTNPNVTMYSADERIEIWRKFNRCGPDPVVVKKGDEIVVYTYTSPSGLEVAICKIKDQGHHVRKDLRDSADSLALDFLLKHKRR